MQFQVPQFIEVEDKIVGPFSFRQFIYMAGAGGLSYLFWRLLPSLIAAPFIIAIMGFAAALAFMEYNGRPFMVALETGFYYLIHTKLYLWNNRTKKRLEQTKKNPIPSNDALYIPKLADSRLHELAWSLDIKERIAAGVGGEAERAALRAEEPLVGVNTARQAIRSLTRQ